MTKTPHPVLFLVGGPNGAGKSTTATTVFGEEARAAEFLNADVIARGLSAFEPERVAFAAGRIMLSRIKELLSASATFAFESTLASRSFAPMISDARARGYRVNLLYIWLNSARLSEKRVAARVASGGHNIPKEDLYRRYNRSVSNFVRLYRPLADEWVVFDNSSRTPRLIASGGLATPDRVVVQSTWRKVMEVADGESQGKD